MRGSDSDHLRKLATKRIHVITKILTKDLSAYNRVYWKRKLRRWKDVLTSVGPKDNQKG